jgi:D-ribose pyranase
VEKIPHVEFKRQSGTAKAVIRTAEFVPYSNVILQAGAWGFKL